MPNRRYYIERDLKESIRIWREEQKGVGDRDIHNLETILYSIKPGSKWFNAGCIRSLRRAIKALEAENKSYECFKDNLVEWANLGVISKDKIIGKVEGVTETEGGLIVRCKMEV